MLPPPEDEPEEPEVPLPPEGEPDMPLEELPPEEAPDESDEPDEPEEPDVPEEPELPLVPEVEPEEPLVPPDEPEVPPELLVSPAALGLLALLDLCLRLAFFFVPLLPLVLSLVLDWPEVAAGLDELLEPVALGLVLLPELDPEAPVPLVPEEPEASLELPEAPDDGMLDAPDEDDDGMLDFEEPLAAPVAASLLGLLVPLTDGDEEEDVPPVLEPVLEPEVCASTTEEADAIRTKDSARSLLVIVMNNSLIERKASSMQPIGCRPCSRVQQDTPRARRANR